MNKKYDVLYQNEIQLKIVLKDYHNEIKQIRIIINNIMSSSKNIMLCDKLNNIIVKYNEYVIIINEYFYYMSNNINLLKINTKEYDTIINNIVLSCKVIKSKIMDMYLYLSLLINDIFKHDEPLLMVAWLSEINDKKHTTDYNNTYEYLTKLTKKSRDIYTSLDIIIQNAKFKKK